MAETCRHAVSEGIDAVAFGDLFLEDVRAYRERQLAPTGLEPLFPLWKIPTDELAVEMIAGGLRARLSCVDTKQLPAALAGREFDLSLLRDLPAAADPCGERGEFHTCVYAGPMFRAADADHHRRSRHPPTALVSQPAQRRVELSPPHVAGPVRFHIFRVRINLLRDLDSLPARFVQVLPMSRAHAGQQRAAKRAAFFGYQNFYRVAVDAGLNLSPKRPRAPPPPRRIPVTGMPSWLKRVKLS
jgi:hypothetical protein